MKSSLADGAPAKAAGYKAEAAEMGP